MGEEDAKLHIDDDWKDQAAQEKARLAEDLEDRSSPHAPPQAGFVEIVQLIATQAVVGLGGLAGPGGQQIPPSLEVAKHFIDLLEVLETKTQGNLTPQEKRILDTTLHQLRMAYVEAVHGPVAPGRAPTKG